MRFISRWKPGNLWKFNHSLKGLEEEIGIQMGGDEDALLRVLSGNSKCSMRYGRDARATDEDSAKQDGQ